MKKCKQPVLARLSYAETFAVLVAVGGPLLAKGIMVRRPMVVGVLQATGLEGAAVRLLQQLRRRHGPGPLMLRLPGREQAVLLSPTDVCRVLAQTPEPFETDSSEKHATLAHFEPEGSLISRGGERAERRALSDRALESDRPIHSLAPNVRTVIEQEIAALLHNAEQVSWGAFKDGWFRIVRRCLFGDAVADDRDLVDMLIRLRSAGNWSFLHARRRTLRARFLSRVAAYLHAAPVGTLGAQVAAHATNRSAAESQVSQWLFAFDAAGIATFRALALIAADERAAARAQRRGSDLSVPARLPAGIGETVADHTRHPPPDRPCDGLGRQHHGEGHRYPHPRALHAPGRRTPAVRAPVRTGDLA